MSNLHLTVPLAAFLVSQLAIQTEASSPAAIAQAAPQSTSTTSQIGERPSAAESLAQATAAIDRLETAGDDATVKALIDEIDGHIERLRARAPGHAWLPYLRGRVYAAVRRQGDAIDQLRRFVESPEGRNEWKAYRVLGDLFVAEYPRLAKANYEKAVTLNPQEPALIFGLSLCAYKLGAMDDAIRLARQAVAADGRKTVRYLAHLANVEQTAQQWDQALADAEAALTLAVGAVTDAAGRHQALLVADAQYQQVIAMLHANTRQRDQVSPDVYVRLATYIRKRASLAGRLAAHELLIVLTAGVDRTAPDTPAELLAPHAAALEAVGRSTDAIAAYERLLKIDPGNAAAAAGLARLRPAAGGTPGSDG